MFSSTKGFTLIQVVPSQNATVLVNFDSQHSCLWKFHEDSGMWQTFVFMFLCNVSFHNFRCPNTYFEQIVGWLWIRGCLGWHYLKPEVPMSLEYLWQIWWCTRMSITEILYCILLRYNWHTILCNFKVYNVKIWHIHIAKWLPQ